jgi:hypothetical protein
MEGHPHGIGWAVKMMQDGHRVARAGWNGRGMYLFLHSSNQVHETAHVVPDGTMPEVVHSVHGEPVTYLSQRSAVHRVAYRLEPHVVMRTVDARMVPWQCSQTDLLAIDWSIV